MDDLLPGNVDDPRFSEQNLVTPIDWSDNSMPYWPLSLAQALLEALPYVLARLVGR